MTLVETTVPNNGKGFGCYFTNGQVINIYWEADGENLKLEDVNGEELTLNTGNTYIGYLDNSYLAGGQFWQ